jgi:hypothetical protein
MAILQSGMSDTYDACKMWHPSINDKRIHPTFMESSLGFATRAVLIKSTSEGGYHSVEESLAID